MRSLAAREPARRRGAGEVLAGEEALRERRPDDLPDPLARAEREHLRLRLAPEHRVLRLARDEPRARQRERRADLLGRHSEKPT